MSKRPYKPTQLRTLEGGRSHSLPQPDAIDEPKPVPIAGRVPTDIDSQAKKVWRVLAPKLEKLGLLTEVDGDLFAGLCQTRSRLKYIFIELKRIQIEIKHMRRKLDKLVKEKSSSDEMDQISRLESVLKSMNSQMAFNMKEERLYLNLFRTQAREFGLTPCSRVGLIVGSGGDGEGADLLT